MKKATISAAVLAATLSLNAHAFGEPPEAVAACRAEHPEWRESFNRYNPTTLTDYQVCRAVADGNLTGMIGRNLYIITGDVVTYVPVLEIRGKSKSAATEVIEEAVVESLVAKEKAKLEETLSELEEAQTMIETLKQQGIDAETAHEVAIATLKNEHAIALVEAFNNGVASVDTVHTVTINGVDYTVSEDSIITITEDNIIYVDKTEYINEGVVVDLTEYVNKGVTVDLTEYVNDGVVVDLTKYVNEGVTVDLTKYINEGVIVDLTVEINEGVVVDLTQYVNEGVVVDLTQYVNEGVVVDLTKYINEGVIVDLTVEINEGVVVDLTEYVNDGVVVDINETDLFQEGVNSVDIDSAIADAREAAEEAFVKLTEVSKFDDLTEYVGSSEKAVPGEETLGAGFEIEDNTIEWVDSWGGYTIVEDDGEYFLYEIDGSLNIADPGSDPVEAIENAGYTSNQIFNASYRWVKVGLDSIKVQAGLGIPYETNFTISLGYENGLVSIAGNEIVGVEGSKYIINGIEFSTINMEALEEAIAAAYNAGYDDGYRDGYNDGYVDGYNQGFIDGVNSVK